MDRFDELVTDRRLRLEDLLDHLNRIHDDALYLGEYRAMTTSGSSGRKAVFVYDRRGWVERRRDVPATQRLGRPPAAPAARAARADRRRRRRPT